MEGDSMTGGRYMERNWQREKNYGAIRIGSPFFMERKGRERERDRG